MDRAHDGRKPLAQAVGRLLRIVELLLARPRTREDLIALVDADRNPASITRDIALLRSLGADIPINRKRPYQLGSSSLPLPVSPLEFSALRRICDLAGRGALPESWTLAQLLGRVPRVVREEVEGDRLAIGIHPPAADYLAHARTLEGIRAARNRGRRFRITYQAAAHPEPWDYLIDAADLVWLEGALILHGFCPDKTSLAEIDRCREFRVERILAVQELPEVCSRTTVPKFEFQYRLVPWIVPSFTESTDHRILRPAGDGGLVIAGRTTSLLRARRYLLALGEAAEALDPRALRDDMARVLAATLAIYSQDAQTTT